MRGTIEWVIRLTAVFFLIACTAPEKDGSGDPISPPGGTGKIVYPNFTNTALFVGDFAPMQAGNEWEYARTYASAIGHKFSTGDILILVLAMQDGLCSLSVVERWASTTIMKPLNGSDEVKADSGLTAKRYAVRMVDNNIEFEPYPYPYFAVPFFRHRFVPKAGGHPHGVLKVQHGASFGIPGYELDFWPNDGRSVYTYLYKADIGLVKAHLSVSEQGGIPYVEKYRLKKCTVAGREYVIPPEDSLETSSP